MSDALALSYGQQLASLVAMMADQWQWPSPEDGFTLHTFAAAGAELPFTVVDTGLSEAHRRRLGEGPILAIAGYLLATGKADQELQKAWAVGLARLTSRQPFPRYRESFFTARSNCWAFSLGLAASSEVGPSHRRWLLHILKQGYDPLREADLWAQLLGACAAHAVGLTWHLPSVPRAQECRLEKLALLVWLHLTHPNLHEAAGLDGRDREYQEALLLRTALTPLPQLDVSRAAVVYVALAAVNERFIRSSTERYWQLGRDGRDAVELVTTLCSRFHLFALQLQKRHGKRPTIAFDDEYDVQDVMHASCAWSLG